MALREKTELLTALPTCGFAPQMTVTVADANLLESAAPTNGVAVAVLQQCIAGTAGTKEDLDRVRKRLAKIKKGLQQVAGMPKKRFSLESVALRLASPFFLAPGTAYLPILAVAQQAKANAARAKAEATRPGENLFYAAPRLALHLSPHSSFCLSSAFGWSGGRGGKRRPQRARHGRQLRHF